MLLQEITKTLLVNSYSSTLQSRIRILKEVGLAVEQGHLCPGISGEELTLVVDEAVTNAMEHGNRWNENKVVTVSVWTEESLLHISIEDEGEGFDYRNHKSDFAKGNLLSQRGRGISLIKRFCSPEWAKSGRFVDLRIPLYT